MKPINIPLSKKKIALLILGSMLFVVAGCWMFFFQTEHQTHFKVILVKTIGTAAMIFFGATGIIGIQKLFDTQMGLIIDHNGITDNSSGVSVGLIEWADITALRTSKVMSPGVLCGTRTSGPRAEEPAVALTVRRIRANPNALATCDAHQLLWPE